MLLGVPQGSVIGPKSFIAYTEELDSVFLKHDIHRHGYADDTQAYVAVTRPNAPTVAPRLQHCLRDVNDFYGSRRLQLNASKTEVMWFGSAALLRGLTVSDKNVTLVTPLCNQLTQHGTWAFTWTACLTCMSTSQRQRRHVTSNYSVCDGSAIYLAATLLRTSLLH